MSSSVSSALSKRLDLQVSSLKQLSKRVLCDNEVAVEDAPLYAHVRRVVTKLLENPRLNNMRKVGSGSFVHYEVRSPLNPDRWLVYRGLRPSLKDRFYPHLSDAEQLPYARFRATQGKPPRAGGDSDADARTNSDYEGSDSGEQSLGSSTSGCGSCDEMDVDGGHDHKRARTTSATAPPRQKSNAKFCIGYGTEHGSLVHSQIQRIIDSYKHGYRSPVGVESIDPCVCFVIEVLNRKAWVPIATELMIYDETLHVATQADLIVFDMTEKCARVIELTFGYEDVEFEEPISKGDRFVTPLDMAPNSPAQRKLLQLWFTTEILRRNYGLNNTARTLLRVCPRSHLVWEYNDVAWWDEARALKNAYDTLNIIPKAPVAKRKQDDETPANAAKRKR